MIDGWTARDVSRVIRVPGADDDKYSRGVVGIRTGSAAYPGAAVLGVEAAWRTGVGMVRYVGSASGAVLARRPETVTADGRVQAWVIGSGTDAATRPESETAALRGILAGENTVVVDAGALDVAVGAEAPVIATPHDREHARLREACGLDAHIDDRAAAAAETARALDAVVVLKGARTVIADAHGAVRRLTVDVPWLATAGTGDVLAGVLGALAATSDADPLEIAASAVWLHARAAEIAAQAHGPFGGPITALDVAGHLPRAVGEVLAAAG